MSVWKPVANLAAAHAKEFVRLSLGPKNVSSARAPNSIVLSKLMKMETKQGGKLNLQRNA